MGKSPETTPGKKRPLSHTPSPESKSKPRSATISAGSADPQTEENKPDLRESSEQEHKKDESGKLAQQIWILKGRLGMLKGLFTTEHAYKTKLVRWRFEPEHEELRKAMDDFDKQLKDVCDRYTEEVHKLIVEAEWALEDIELVELGLVYERERRD